MTTTVRSNLDALARGSMPPGAHAGLWLDKYYWAVTPVGPGQAQQAAAAGEDPATKANHIAKVVQKDKPEAWDAAFAAWQTRLVDTPRPDGHVVRFFSLTTRGRCVLGLGTESPWENNIRLHHTWGLPVLPGSALKGLASARAHRLGDTTWSKQTSATSPAMAKEVEPNHHSTLFGTTDDQGCVIFHDALWAPDNNDNGLRQDVLTVHHRDYYMATDKQKPPADWDSPTPVPFLSVTGTFVLALEGPEKWVEAAAALLKGALEEDGIGAKTSSGYGRMLLKEKRVQSGSDAEILSQLSGVMKGEGSLKERLEQLFLPDNIRLACELSPGSKEILKRDIFNKFTGRLRGRAEEILMRIGH